MRTCCRKSRTIEVEALAARDIIALHKLPAKAGKVPGIIIRFSHLALRDVWLAKRQALKNSKDIYMCENMTAWSRKILTAVKEWMKESGFKYAWHVNGFFLAAAAARDKSH